MTSDPTPNNVLPRGQTRSSVTTLTSKNLFKGQIESLVPSLTPDKLGKGQIRSSVNTVTPARLKVTIGHRVPSARSRKAKKGRRIQISKSTIKKTKSHPVFVRILKEADDLLWRVMGYLTGEDLLRLSHVNRHLRHLIQHDRVLEERRMSYLQGRMTDCDQLGKVRMCFLLMMNKC